MGLNGSQTVVTRSYMQRISTELVSPSQHCLPCHSDLSALECLADVAWLLSSAIPRSNTTLCFFSCVSSCCRRYGHWMTPWWLNNSLNIFLVEYSTLLIFTEVTHLLDSCQLTRELLEKEWCGIQGVRGNYRGCCHLPDLNPCDFHLGVMLKKVYCSNHCATGN